MSGPRFITAGEIQNSTLYVQFMAKLNDAQDVSQLFTIGGANLIDQDTALYVYADSDALTFRGAHGVNMYLPDDFTVDEWHTIQIAIHIVAPTIAICGGSLDGSPVVHGGASIAASVFGELQITQFAFGAINAADTPVNHHIKEITIGTAGFGSYNIFKFDLESAALNDSPIPQFDSVTGDGLSIDNDGILFENEGTDVYATKALIFP